MRGAMGWSLVVVCLAMGEAARAAEGAAAAGGSAAAAAPCAAPAAAPARPTVRVDVTSDHGGTALFRVGYLGNLVVPGRHGGISELTHVSRVCAAPCRPDLEPQDDVSYYVDGPGITPSTRFAVSDGTSRLRVQGGSSTVAGLGAAATIVGLVALGPGAVLWAMGDAPRGHMANHTLGAAGMGTFIAGAALIAIGIPLLLASRTHVADESGRRLARAARPRVTLDGLVF